MRPLAIAICWITSAKGSKVAVKEFFKIYKAEIDQAGGVAFGIDSKASATR
jgi:hypothetical protein